MSQYSYLTDKLAEKILSKTERVENLKLHYNSKITNNTIEFIKLRLSNLRRLSLKSVEFIIILFRNPVNITILFMKKF